MECMGVYRTKVASRSIKAFCLRLEAERSNRREAMAYMKEPVDERT
jgi:hypothetical protein